MVDCYTGSDNGVIFLSEAAVVNLTDTLQRKLKRLAQVSKLAIFLYLCVILASSKYDSPVYNPIYYMLLCSTQSQVKGVVLLEQTPSSDQYLVEVQERLTIELGLMCIPVKSPAHAAKMIKTMVSYCM